MPLIYAMPGVVKSVRVIPPPGRPITIAPPRPDFARRYHDGRGKYRVFNAAEYRFYRSNSGPPAETDTPFATNATLPHEPADVYADGTWYLSVSYFNGVIDSGFLPVGANGETYLRLDIAGGVVIGSPPNPANEAQLEVRAGGVVAVVGSYYQEDALRATQWAIAYTFNGANPPADTPDYTEAMPGQALCILDYELTAQVHGTTVKARVQTRRDDGGWIYSEDSVILTATADATGPAAPEGLESWRGRLPEDV